MPILLPFRSNPLSEEEFCKLDFAVMGQAFACQNELGRLCDEGVYQRDLAARLELAGLAPVRVEQRIELEHQGFVKHYDLDLVVGPGAIYELKAVASLAREHEGQLLNYLLLAGQPHGKLINFKSPEVQTRFVNMTLSESERRCVSLDETRWQPRTPRCGRLRQIVTDLLADWGGFLEIAAYRDAITHFLGGEQDVIQLIPMHRGNVPLGLQPWHLLTPKIAFRLTALTERPEKYEAQLRRLLRLTDLQAMHWINLGQHTCEFTTIERE